MSNFKGIAANVAQEVATQEQQASNHLTAIKQFEEFIAALDSDGNLLEEKRGDYALAGILALAQQQLAATSDKKLTVKKWAFKAIDSLKEAIKEEERQQFAQSNPAIKFARRYHEQKGVYILGLHLAPVKYTPEGRKYDAQKVLCSLFAGMIKQSIKGSSPYDVFATVAIFKLHTLRTDAALTAKNAVELKDAFTHGVKVEGNYVNNVKPTGFLARVRGAVIEEIKADLASKGITDEEVVKKYLEEKVYPTLRSKEFAEANINFTLAKGVGGQPTRLANSLTALAEKMETPDCKVRGTLLVAVRVYGHRIHFSEKTGLSPDYTPLLEVVDYELIQGESLINFSEKDYISYEDIQHKIEHYHNTVFEGRGTSKEAAELCIKEQEKLLDDYAKANSPNVTQKMDIYKKGISSESKSSPTPTPSVVYMDDGDNELVAPPSAVCPPEIPNLGMNL
jgi:hypothetical protein